MPRIMAPTLAENRDQRRAALLAAGHELVRAGGPRALTMAGVATRAGLSRPAVYEYFDSTQDLLAAVLLDEMRRWSGDVVDHLAAESTPETKIARYVEVSLGLIADGRHEIIAVMSETSLPKLVRQQINELHATLAAPLTQAVAALGIADTDQAVRLIQGVVEAAARRLLPGSDPKSQVQASTAFVLGGLRALATH
ncbi:hypothetical protein LBMAG15_10600 [Actinomycetes bacterium]|nr:hypothetical protein LBMAG15_10600 [Actinomycetes bacterium]